MAPTILVCECGLRMKAPGARPGRVGKCPRCGSILKVPEEPVSPPTETAASPRPTFVRSRSQSETPKRSRTRSDGLVAHPRIAETRYLDSLSYPLWNASGIAMLAFMPVLLWFCTAPLFAILPSILSGPAFTLVGVIFLVPQLLLMGVVVGYIFLFFGQVLVSSALGEVVQPRSPGWDLSEILEGLGRWFWALLIGGVVGGLPAVTYWIGCGKVDFLDRIVLTDLILPGLAYAQMALLAALIHESPLAANPVTVLRAIFRLGWSYGMVCAETAGSLVVLFGIFGGLLQIRNPLGLNVGCWLFWVIALYGSLVVFRRLGLYCYRNSVILDWFPERSRASA